MLGSDMDLLLVIGVKNLPVDIEHHARLGRQVRDIVEDDKR